MKTIAIILLVFGQLTCFTQNVNGVRYEISYNPELVIINGSPSQTKKQIAKDIETFLPQYMDQVIIDNKVVEMFWMADGTFNGLKIYNDFEEGIVEINEDGKMKTEEYQYSPSFNYESDYDSITSVTGRELVNLLDEKNNVPVRLYFNRKELTIGKSNFKEPLCPTMSFLETYKSFPLSIVQGEPNAIIIFDFTKPLEPNDFEEDLSNLMKNLKRKKSRKEFIEKLTFN